MVSPAFRIAIPATVSVATVFYSTQVNTISNDSKRRGFYEDDNQVTPIPGSVVPASSTELEALGPNKLVNGVSVRSPSTLESAVRGIRLKTHEYYLEAKTKYEELAKRYYTAEREVTSTISSLHERKEDLLPNSIYVIVGVLTGSIVSRRRNFLIRGVSPLLFGLISFKYFLPETFDKTKNFVWNMEKKNLPQLAEQQLRLYQKGESLVNDAEKSYESTKQQANNSILSTGKAFADFTGLNINQDVTKKNDE